MADRVLIIAEAGVNHNGSLQRAKELADAAKDAGADIVKLQVFNADLLATQEAEKAEYQIKRTGFEKSQLEMLKELELTTEEFVQLHHYCGEIGIEFLATSFDQESTRFLAEDLSQRLFKIPSGELNNYPYLVSIARYGRPIILSTGMSTMEEISDSIEVLQQNSAGKITLLHCTTQYPTPFEEVNLRAMQTLADTFEVPVGYSDHTEGIEVPLAAVALGATVIEKHFTLDRSLPGPDHMASLEPQQLKAMVDAIRNTEQALGSAEKHVTPSEVKNRSLARKSIVAARDIKENEVLSEETLTTKRPGGGLSPMRWPEVIGTNAKRAFKKDEMIEL